MTESQAAWYIIKTEGGQCQIIPGSQISAIEQSPSTRQWGPFASQDEAIARRIGLIRSGRCKPKVDE